MPICKYSQLYSAGATKDQILAVSKKLNKTPEEIIQLTSEVDPTRKYEVWLLKQMAFLNIRLPEDVERVQNTLKKFEQLNQHRQLQYQNINQYKTIMELEVEIKNKIPKELGEAYDYRLQEYMKLDGVKLYGQNSDYLILEVSNPKSLTELGQDTGWCTKHLKHAEHYLVEEGNKQYVVFKKENNKYVKFAQFAEDFSQFKNIDDHEMSEVDDSLYELVTSKLKAPFSFIKRNGNAIYSWLEKNKVVEDSLNLWNCTSLTSLLEGLSVKGNLDLTDCTSLESLPTGLSIGGYLDLTDCTSLKSLPTGLSIGGNLYLEDCTGLKSLPTGLSIGGNLYLEGCTSLESLPTGLSVRGNLELTDCTSLESLPTGLFVEGYLDLTDCTSLESLPEDLIVKGFIYGTYPKTGESYQKEYNEIVRRRQQNKTSS